MPAVPLDPIPQCRETESTDFPKDLAGRLGKLGKLLDHWIENVAVNESHVGFLDPGKHPRSAEVFPLPLPEREPSLSEHVHHWLQAIVKALNWLACGRAQSSVQKPSEHQASLLQVLCSSAGQLSTWEAHEFDVTCIEEYWKARSVNGYGEEIHCPVSLRWENIEHSLPQREVAGVLNALEVTQGGVKDFLANPISYLKPENKRMWTKCPRVMVPNACWGEVATGLVSRGICDVIPLQDVLHVDGQPILGGMF